MTDCKIILDLLSDGKWWNVIDLMHTAKPGAINFACRSRIADLRKKGFHIISEIAENGCAKYRWVQKSEQGILL